MKEELDGKLMTEFAAALRSKTYSYLVDDGGEHRSKRNKKVS